MDQQLIFKIMAALASLLVALTLARYLLGVGIGAKRPPSQLSWPWLGDSIAFVRNPVGLLSKRHKQLGEIYSHVLMGQTFIQVGNLHNIKKLLAAEGTLVRGAMPLSFKLLLGDGSLANAHGESHRSLRQMLAPAFTPKAIAGYLPRLEAIFNAYIDDWIRRGDVKGMDEVTAATFKVAVEVILGFDDSWFEAKRFEKVQAAWRDFLVGLFSAPFWWLRYVPGTGEDLIQPAWPTTSKHGLTGGLKARKYLLGLTHHSLDLIQEQIDSGKVENTAESANVGQAVLRQKDEAGRHLSRAQAADLCMNTLFAGHETTAKSILCLLLTLKQYPAEYEELLREQEKVIAEHGSAINEASLRDMPYADACMREVVRLYPIAAAVIRDAQEDFMLDGYQIYKGDTLWLNLRRVTRDTDPRWLQDDDFPPEEFAPKRWFSERGRAPATILSFSGGPRLCLGMSLALTELKMLTVLMLRRCTWEVDIHEKVVTFPITHPVNGLPMTVKARDPPLA